MRNYLPIPAKDLFARSLHWLGLITILILVTGCFNRAAMSRDVYDSIQVGMPIADVQSWAGEPRDIRSKGNEHEEYEYSERIKIIPQPDHFSIENIYYIEVVHGIVAGKRMTTTRTPAYNILYQTQPNFAAP